MTKLTSILQDRFRKKEKPKMSELAELATEGALTVFSGFFGKPELGSQEKEILAELLNRYASNESKNIDHDLSSLSAITSEVKAINNQATILHGERIKKAQNILKKYREGAFTAWLMTAYGNRQTPYNFLQYYEFYHQAPQDLRPQIEWMPRQAVYTLASREGDFSQKEEIVRNYRGESKQEMISLIRGAFPLSQDDRRKENLSETLIKQLERISTILFQAKPNFSHQQKQTMIKWLQIIQSSIEGK